MNFKRLFTKPVKWVFYALAKRVVPDQAKKMAEIDYWKTIWEREGHKFGNKHYQNTMLAMANEKDGSFLKGKIVADFGCGPRGSLSWAKSARIRIGIDVLADKYSCFDISSHDMCYVCSTEISIPLPTNYVDVLFTINALDHVSNFEIMCKEVLRILTPGGDFIGSINLEEPKTICEPQTLTEEYVKECLLNHLEIISFRTAGHSKPGCGTYSHFYDNSPEPKSGKRILWVRAKKPQ